MATRVIKRSESRMQKIKLKDDKAAIPKFGYKSAFIIALVAALTNFFLPNILLVIGANIKITTLLLNSTLISLAVCYCHYFIETKNGFQKNAVYLYVALSIGIGIISYFWLYIGLYM